MNKQIVQIGLLISLFLPLKGFSMQAPLSRDFGIARPVTEDKKILKGLRDFSFEYKKLIPVAGVELITQIEFLPPEHQLEAETFFVHKWAENQEKLAGFVKIIGKAGEGFATREGFTAISVGTLDTHLYYVLNGKIESFVFPFGTKSEPNDQAALVAINDMLKIVENLKRPSIYFNAISYAQIPGYAPIGTSYIELAEEIELETKGSTGLSGRMGMLLSEHIRRRKIVGAFIHQAPKELKFSYGWTTTLVKNRQQLHYGNHVIGDFSNSSFSAKLVKDQEVVGNNMVKDDRYTDLNDILLHQMTKAERGLHPRLKIYVDRIIDDVKKYIIANPNEFAGQSQVQLLIGFTGRLSELFHDCAKRISDFEEKKGEPVDALPPPGAASAPSGPPSLPPPPSFVPSFAPPPYSAT